jgi:hypothetical protein
MESKSNDEQFDRWSWLTLMAVILFSLAVLATTLAILALPGDGWQMIYEEPPLSRFLGDWPTLLQEGDVVLAVDGVIFDPGGLSPLSPPSNWQAGATVPYTIERDGQQQTIEVLLDMLSIRGILRAMANTMLADLPQWSWFVVGLIVFILRPGSPPARLLFLAGACLVMTTKIGWAATTVSASFAPTMVFFIYQMTNFVWGWIFFPSIILFLLYFAQPVWPLTHFPRLTPSLLFLVPLGVSLITFLADWIVPGTVLLVVEAVLIVVTAVVVVVLAYRPGSDPVTRAQVSWVAFGVAISIGGTLIAYLLNLSGWVDFRGGLLESILSWPVGLALPICLAIAILRYRLFDIEVIIRKTLVYTVLTGVLALVYFGLVVVLQSIVDAAGGQQSTIVIVISTLVIAALFAPLRRAVQNVIDRRFFRKKYDAEQVLKQFIASARNETDVDVLTAELEHAVRETLQPTLVSVWLRDRNPALIPPYPAGSQAD